jgi:hypothetical protein
MDRERFEQLLEAYGADPRRWPADERAAAEAFAAQNADAANALREARALDAALDQGRAVPDTTGLAARILAHAPKPQGAVFDRRAMLALAACAVFGVVLGYGGGLLAPLADDDDSYFADAFAAPFGDEG